MTSERKQELINQANNLKQTINSTAKLKSIEDLESESAILVLDINAVKDDAIEKSRNFVLAIAKNTISEQNITNSLFVEKIKLDIDVLNNLFVNISYNDFALQKIVEVLSEPPSQVTWRYLMQMSSLQEISLELNKTLMQVENILMLSYKTLEDTYLMISDDVGNNEVNNYNNYEVVGNDDKQIVNRNKFIEELLIEEGVD